MHHSPVVAPCSTVDSRVRRDAEKYHTAHSQDLQVKVNVIVSYCRRYLLYRLLPATTLAIRRPFLEEKENGRRLSIATWVVYRYLSFFPFRRRV